MSLHRLETNNHQVFVSADVLSFGKDLSALSLNFSPLWFLCRSKKKKEVRLFLCVCVCVCVCVFSSSLVCSDSSQSVTLLMCRPAVASALTTRSQPVKTVKRCIITSNGA